MSLAGTHEERSDLALHKASKWLFSVGPLAAAFDPRLTLPPLMGATAYAAGVGGLIDMTAARRIRINPRMQGMSHGTAGMPAIQPGIE